MRVEQAEPLIVETVLGLLETVAEKKRRPSVAPASSYSESVIRSKPIAYWRLGDMDSIQVEDALGENHARYQGGVALFLPGPNGSGIYRLDGDILTIALPLGLSFSGQPISKRLKETRQFSGSREYLPSIARRDYRDRLISSSTGDAAVAV